MSKKLSDNSELMREWNYSKNIGLNPEDFTVGSGIKVWWKCAKCGNEWQAIIGNRCKGHGCRECANKKTGNRNMMLALIKNGSLRNTHPEIAKHWDYDENNGLTPDDVVAGSGKKVWWRGECGHKWERPIHEFAKNQKCPFCSGKKLLKGFNDLQSKFPNIAQEWNYEKNEKKPEDYLSGSGQRVWWKCKQCGYEWEANIHSRTRQSSGCKACSNRKIGQRTKEKVLCNGGSVLDLHPELLNEWDYQKNTKRPDKVTAYSDEEIWWKCSRCGKSWRTSIRNRTRLKSKCPSCTSSGSSLPEQTVFYYIKKIFPNSQNRYKGLQEKGITELDIWIPDISVGIEYDGAFYHQNRARADRIKDEQCEKAGIRLIRIQENQQLNKLEAEDQKIEFAYHGIQHIEEMTPVVATLISKLLNIEVTPNFVDAIRDQNDIFETQRKYELENSLAEKYPDLAAEWHPTRNGELKPSNFSARNGAKVWWKCSKCGHEWKTTIASRSAGTGCSICSANLIGRNIIKSKIAQYGSLADNDPSLAEEWHPSKNGTRTPADFTVSSGEKVWWQCPVCHGEWDAVIASRHSGVGCPYCAGLRVLPGFNDFATKRPDLAKDWDFEKNKNLPDTMSRNAKILVHWKCSQCGHEWEQKLANNKHGCPLCRKKLK